MTLPSLPLLLSYEIPELLNPLFWQIPCHFPRRRGALDEILNLIESVSEGFPSYSSGTSVLFQGVECGFVNVPLHNIYLSSDLVKGPVAVGIRQTLPFKGVHLL